MSRFVREKFDEKAPGFVVRRNLLLQGVHYVAGDALEVGVITTRRARQLYDTRRIDMAKADLSEEISTEEEKPKRTRKAKPKVDVPAEWWKLPVDELKQMALSITGEEAPNRKEAIKTIKGYVDGLSA